MDLKYLTWDYPEPLKDDEWRAGRIGEFFSVCSRQPHEQRRRHAESGIYDLPFQKN